MAVIAMLFRDAPRETLGAFPGKPRRPRGVSCARTECLR